MVYDAATGCSRAPAAPSRGYLRGIAVDTVTGNLWLTSDTSAAQMYVVSPTGTLLRTICRRRAGHGA